MIHFKKSKFATFFNTLNTLKFVVLNYCSYNQISKRKLSLSISSSHVLEIIICFTLRVYTRELSTGSVVRVSIIKGRNL